MNRVVNFESKDEFNSFLDSVTREFLGFGAEGSCYRGRDGLAYKCLGIDEDEESEYTVDEIITTADIQTEAFALPDTIFTVKDSFAGYTSKLISPNLFSNQFLVDKNTVSHISFDKLISAYYSMFKDVDYFTSQGIKIYDLGFNLLYDGKRLYGVDTCAYSWDNSITFEENRESLSDAMKKAFFGFLLRNDNKYVNCDNAYAVLLKDMEEADTECFLRDIERKYSNKEKSNVYIKK